MYNFLCQNVLIFIIIEQLRNIQTRSTVTLKEKLKQRENFFMMKLETLAPLGLNQDFESTSCRLSVHLHYFSFLHMV